MGWNFSVAKGGIFGALIACWFAGILYSAVVTLNSELGSSVTSAGAQYAQAKHILGPLAAFNIGLFLVFEYVMLEAADAIVVGQIIHKANPQLNASAFVVLTVAVMSWLNYRGIHASLTFQFVITAIAAASILLLLVGGAFWSSGGGLSIAHMLEAPRGGVSPGSPYGWLGFLAGLQFGMWFYLGIEGTAQVTEECRAPARALPLGTMTGIMTLAILATITWFVGVGLVGWTRLGKSAYPLYDAAQATGRHWLVVVLFAGTVLACLASANGCITDASRAWFAMGRDQFVPRAFGAVHPRYRTPYRAIIFLLPIAISFGYTGLLDQVVTFSIISGLLLYGSLAIMMLRFRRLYPIGAIERGYVSPLHPLPALILLACVATVFVAIYFGYWRNLIAAMSFYLIASIWFVVHRYKFVDRSRLYTMPWPRPREARR
jgi:ethanolamine permease